MYHTYSCAQLCKEHKRCSSCYSRFIIAVESVLLYGIGGAIHDITTGCLAGFPPYLNVGDDYSILLPPMHELGRISHLQ